jgi:UDP-N-acetylmuramate--alanine ligase
VLTDIHAAGEPPLPGVTIEALAATFPDRRRPALAPRKQLTARLLEMLRPGDLLLTLGAGDITQVAGEVLAKLRDR